MKKNLCKQVAVIAITAFTLTSCATIVTGTTPKVTINGNTKEPVDITTSYMTYTNVTLPTTVKIKRKHLDGQTIKISSPNYKYRDIMIQKETNSWAWGNILIGGLIGWIVDLSTNCVSAPSTTNYYVSPITE